MVPGNTGRLKGKGWPLKATPLLANVETGTDSATARPLPAAISGVTFGDPAFLNLPLRAHQHTDLRLVGPRPIATSASAPTAAP
jgi:hypothetical protein